MNDHFFMERALELALNAQGRTSPNPLVGCVLVKEGRIIGEGYHAKAGTPHAEVNALRAAGDQASGSEAYVTLEPCSHFGRTPPCADALIKAGIKRVVVAMTDPNPLVKGQGIKKLQEAGITVELGLLAEKAAKANEAFIKVITRKLPFVLYKSALTFDGKTSVSSGDSKWITSEGARQYVHGLRNSYDVVMVGSGTVIRDNPLLTCRGIQGGRDPVKLIVDGTLALPLNSQVLTTPDSALTIIATSQAADPNKLQLLLERINQQKANLEIWQYPTDHHVPLGKLMQDAAAKGFNSILLEGGGILAGKMLEENLIDKIEFIYAPKLAGSGTSPLSGFHLDKMAEAVQIRDWEISDLFGDIKISGYINYK